MSRRAWTIALLVLWPLAAAAQPASGGSDQTMLGMRLFNQSCRVCHTKPQLTSPQYGPVLSHELARRQDDVMREVISNGTPRMPGFKYHFEPAADRRHRRLSQNRSRAVRAPPPAKPARRADARRETRHGDRHAPRLCRHDRSLPSPRSWSRRRPAPTPAERHHQIVGRREAWAASRSRPSPTAAPSPPRSSPTTTGNYYFPPLPAGSTGSGRRRSASRPPRARSICGDAQAGLHAHADATDFVRAACRATSCSRRCRRTRRAGQAHEAHRAQQSAPAATPRATCCSTASTRPAGTPSSS